MRADNKKQVRNEKTEAFLRVFRAVLVLAVTGLVGFFVYSNTLGGHDHKFPFKLGLDLAGGRRRAIVRDPNAGRRRAARDR